LLTVAEYAPIFLFSFVGGMMADRWNLKRMMVTADFLTMLSIGLIAVLVQLGHWPLVFLATFLSAMLSQVSQPSSAKLFKRHVSDKYIPVAVGVSQGLVSLFLIVGPLLGTALYMSLGVAGSFGFMVGAFGLSALVLAFLPVTTPPEKEKSNLVSEIGEAWRFLRREANIQRLLIAFVLVGLGAGLIQPLEVFIVTQRLQLNQEYVQWFTAIGGFGFLLGSGIAVVLSPRLNVRLVLLGGLFTIALSVSVEAVSVWPVLTGGMRLVVSVLLAFINILISSYMIRHVPEGLVGKVNGILLPLFVGATLFGTSFSGLLMNRLGLVNTYLAAAFVILLSVVPGLGIHLGKPESSHPNRDFESA
jgi:MFS family permease